MKKFICALLTVVMVASLAGCGSMLEGISRSTSGSSDAITAENGYAEGRLGDVMRTYFFDYTVNSAYTCTEFNGYTPDSGNILLVANVTVKNTDNSSIEMYDTDFQIQWGDDDNDDAYDYPITWYADPVSDEQLPGTYDLGVNEEKTGLLVYEVPEGSKDFSISYLELFSDDSEGDVFFVFFTAKSNSL